MSLDWRFSITATEVDAPYNILKKYYGLCNQDSLNANDEALWDEVEDNYSKWGRSVDDFKKDLKEAKAEFFSKILSNYGASEEDFLTWLKIRHSTCNILRIDTGSSSSYVDLKRVSWINIDKEGVSLRSNLKNHNANFAIGSKLFFDDIQVKPIHVLDAWERLKKR
jgi:hypothetical protein